MNIRWRLVLLLCVALFGACTPKSDSSVDKDPLENAYRLLDRGDTNEAIGLLEELAGKDSRPQVREALASAYAARAGLRIDSYWEFLSSFQAPQVSRHEIQNTSLFGRLGRVVSQMETRGDIEGAKGVVGLATLFAALELWERRIDVLPVVRGPARQDLQKAIAILNGSPRQGGRLYRALLGLVVFRSDVKDGFNGWGKIETLLSQIDWKNPVDKQRQLLCSERGVNFPAFVQWSTALINNLGGTLEDVARAYPSKRPEFEGALRESSKISQQFQALGESACR